MTNGACIWSYAQDTQAAEDNQDDLRPQLDLQPPEEVDRDTQQDNVCQDRGRCDRLALLSRSKRDLKGLKSQEKKANVPWNSHRADWLKTLLKQAPGVWGSQTLRMGLHSKKKSIET